MNALASGFDFKEIQDKVSLHLRPWHRSFQFWVRAADIYTGYKVFQLRVSFVKDPQKQQAMWDKQHELAADKIYAMCYDLGGFFLKIIGKPDLAPAAWVKRLVQHPGIQDLMMTDIRNLQAFALYIQKTDIKFDLFSVTKEMEKQVCPRTIQGYVEKMFENALRVTSIKAVPMRVLVMDYIDGVPILNLGDEMAKRGINPGGKMATSAKQNILKSLTLAYGQMILKTGFFHADPHPGNILICKGSEVALLDYGQVKDLPDQLRLGFADLVLAMADSNPVKATESYRELGIDTVSNCKNEQQEMLRLAQTMFDTKLPPGVEMLQPFSEDASIKKIGVQSFPEELFSVLRTVHLLRGLSVGLGINYSCAEQWRPMAEEALYNAGRLKGILFEL
ncbi:putative aarF domain-containing protein kinase 1-like isoform X2 [Gossypium australe]|uniref:Putative aarF domain-containing protein kinase 1-like isoform X2 n=1 Tax=Gossypium australe TaxID=47621 RepID=A0A5B6UWX8_9ROSI|nr:putative aarF domain-containing protein kinase 1-like isoform X2 [Gossypium australe]